MFLPIWLMTLLSIALAWSIWLNFGRSKQIKVLKYCFVTIADLSLDKIKAIKRELTEDENDPPAVLVNGESDIEHEIEYLLAMQFQAGVASYSHKDGAKSLGI